jgi:hypothetical protein
VCPHAAKAATASKRAAVTSTYVLKKQFCGHLFRSCHNAGCGFRSKVAFFRILLDAKNCSIVPLYCAIVNKKQACATPMFSRLIVIAVILRGPRPNDGTALPNLIEHCFAQGTLAPSTNVLMVPRSLVLCRAGRQ